MAEEKTRNAPEENEEDSQEQTDEKSPRFPLRRWIVIGTIGLLVVNGIAGVYFGLRHLGRKSDPGSEVSLGEFQFIRKSTDDSPIAQAEFNLHISLLSELGPTAQALLRRHKFRVQQDVEQLLRQANPDDFEDPKLTELKRQLQETINRTLEKRVIAEVIITDLSVERVATTENEPEEEASASQIPDATWQEKAPG